MSTRGQGWTIVTFVVMALACIGMALALGFKWNCTDDCERPPTICPPCPECPECPQLKAQECPEPNQELQDKNVFLMDMIRYTTLIIKRYEAEKELHKLSHGYAQVFNSPKLEYLKKELSRMLRKVKSNPEELTFFQRHLNNVIE